MMPKLTVQELENKVEQLEDKISEHRDKSQIMGLYEKIVAEASIGITIYDFSGNCVIANSSAARFIGAKKEQVLKQNFHNIDSWKKIGLYDLAVKSISNGREYSREISAVSSFGKKVSLYCRFVPFNYRDKQYLSLMYEDITERTKSQKELGEMLQRFNAMIEASPIAIIFLDIEGKVLLWSPAAEKIFGWTADEVMGKTNPVVPEHKESEFRENLYNVLSGNAIENLEIRRIRKDGRSIDLSLYVTPLHDANKKVVGVVCMMTDITRRRKMERDLRQAHKMEAVGALAGGIAHDFNNILTSILGFSDLALQDVQKETVLEDSLQEIYTSGKRARDLVKQILTYARQSELKLKTVRLSTIISEAIKLLRPSIPTSIEIKSQINSKAMIEADPSMIHQVIMNLCTNAYHAMEDRGGLMEICLDKVELEQHIAPEKFEVLSGKHLKLTVSDSGDGIPPELIDSVFDPYFTTKDTREGTGMGLAVVYSIVSDLKGVVTVDSKPGKGSLFSVFLPVSQKKKKPKHRKKVSPPGGNERILFVDDEPTIVKLNKDALERLGYSVQTKTSSHEALELFRSNPDGFDLVITDMTMPKMNGDILSVELMNIRPDIPIILCTGYSKKISNEKSKKIGIKAFAYKPIIIVDLAKTIRKILDETKTGNP